MAAPLLTTKLYTPSVRPEWMSRPRLIERLNAAFQCKLTLVSAPAGFGKTTLLAEWASGHEHPIAWLTLDRSDNDSTRFWAYFITALQKVQADLGEAALTLLYSFMRDTGAGLHQEVPLPYRYDLLIAGETLYIVAFVLAWRNTVHKSRPEEEQ